MTGATVRGTERTLPGGDRIWEINWARVGRRALIGSVIVLGALFLYLRYEGPTFGFDFHGGSWSAARAILAGHSPYVRPDGTLLLHTRNAFVTPPILGELAIPLSLLKFKLAAVLWDLIGAAAFGAALWLLGLRDLRLYVVAFCSFPFLDSMQLAQSDGVLALLAALAWRYRDSPWSGLAIGTLIAAKLLAWPLLVWLLLTRRFRSFAVACVSAAGLLIASWAPIDFHGMTSYPALLAADAKAFSAWDYSNSITGALVGIGVSQTIATGLTVVVALLVAVAMVVGSRRSDAGWFGACLIFGLLASPILWPHYLVFLFLVLAIARPRSFAPWASTAALWVAAFSVDPMLRVSVVLATTIAVAIWAVHDGQLRVRTRAGFPARRSDISAFATEQNPSALI